MILTRRHSELDESLFQRLMQEHEKSYTSGTLINNKEHQGVSECGIDGVKYIIKCYTSTSPLSALRLLTNSSRADRSFNFAQILTDNNIATPKHLLIIKHISITKNSTYLIMEKSKGTGFFHYIQPESPSPPPEQALQNIGELIQKLQKLDIHHGDLHTRNILINQDNSIEIIDLDGATHSPKGKQKDLSRLKHALQKTPQYWKTILSNTTL